MRPLPTNGAQLADADDDFKWTSQRTERVDAGELAEDEAGEPRAARLQQRRHAALKVQLHLGPVRQRQMRQLRQPAAKRNLTSPNLIPIQSNLT